MTDLAEVRTAFATLKLLPSVVPLRKAEAVVRGMTARERISRRARRPCERPIVRFAVGLSQSEIRYVIELEMKGMMIILVEFLNSAKKPK